MVCKQGRYLPVVPACKGCGREGERSENLCLIKESCAHSMLKVNEGSTSKDCRPGCGAWEKENSLWGREE